MDHHSRGHSRIHMGGKCNCFDVCVLLGITLDILSAYCAQTATVKNKALQVLRLWIPGDVLFRLLTVGVELHHQGGLLD